MNAANNYQERNRSGWAQGGTAGWKAASAVGVKELQHGKEILDPDGWICWDKTKDVLCLAGGGGQQGPLFASLGCNVTVLDFSPEQLAEDRRIADQHGFNIELIEGNLLDLSSLYKRKFDLVYQPLSAHHIPDVKYLYRQIAGLLNPGGHYFSTHWNPVFFQLPLSGNAVQWDGEGYRLIRSQEKGKAVRCTWKTDNNIPKEIELFHFIHTLSDLIGGLCELGFVIHHFKESKSGNKYAAPESLEHISSFFPITFRIFCSKP